MASAIESFASGFAQAIANLFNGPLKFLSGKSCSSICSSTWDFICFIEHFCVVNLLKLGLIILVLYIVLLFFYLSYKLRIYHCICQTLCKALWAFFAVLFYIWHHTCHFLCHKLLSTKRRRRRRRRTKPARDIEDYHYSTEEDHEHCEESSVRSSCNQVIENRSSSRRWKEHRRSHLRKSLRPRSHRVQVEISSLSRGQTRQPRKKVKFDSNEHHIRVTHTSKFAQKGSFGSRVRRL